MNKSLIIFGIVNITSDSFSDGGRYLAPDAAIAQARKLMAEGADVIDLGPASSNPDAAPVSSDTEIARIAPVLDALKADGIPVSLDSYQPATQAYALSRGVAYLNDIRGFPDAAFYPQLAKSSAKLVVMHSVQDGQADRRAAPAGDIMDHIAAFFDARIAALTVCRRTASRSPAIAAAGRSDARSARRGNGQVRQSSQSARSRRPLASATPSGVWPSAARACGEAPFRINCFSTASRPNAVARCRADMPWPSRASRSTPRSSARPWSATAT